MSENVKNKSKNYFGGKKIKKIFGHFGLFLGVCFYTIIGALIFQELEYSAEMIRLRQLDKNLENQRLRLVKYSYLCTHDSDKCAEILDDYEFAAAQACKGGLELPLKKANKKFDSKWSFPQAVFFASTVLTTIGYGNTVPNTFWGRLFCIFFALVGIPLTVSMIADLGVLLAVSLSPFLRKAKSYMKLQKFFSTTGKRQWFSAIIMVIFLMFYLSAGAALLMVWEDEWGFFEGFYFCFITMTTIGFGDLIPKSPNFMFICTFYILSGLALTSSFIELVRRQYANSWKTLQTLKGPLAETLKRLGDGVAMGKDMGVLQQDLRKILAIMNVPGKTEDGKEWKDTINSIIEDIKMNFVSNKNPPILQIVIYETTV